MPSRNAKKIIIHNGTVMISASWVLMRIREMKALDNSDYFRGYNKSTRDIGEIIKTTIHRAKWNANKRKADQAKIQSQQP